MAQITPLQHMAYLRYYARKLGWKIWLGISLLLLSLIVFVALIVPKKTAIDQLEREAKTKAGQLKATVKLEVKQDIPQLFYSTLPNGNDANSKVAELLQFAEDNQLTVAKAQYTQKTIAGAALRTIQIKLPVQGSYVQIRRFITQALNHSPTIALESVRFEREDLASELLDAHLQFTLYTQNAGALKGKI